MNANGFRQFSRNNMYVSIPGKLSEIHLHGWMFFNHCWNFMESGSESATYISESSDSSDMTNRSR